MPPANATTQRTVAANVNARVLNRSIPRVLTRDLRSLRIVTEPGVVDAG
jgi:hypothetical protein